MIIGGGLQAENTAVYQAILDGRSGDGPICVFPTASAEPQESMESAVSRIDAVGGVGSALGVFLTVVGVVMVSLAQISRVEERAERDPVPKGPMDIPLRRGRIVGSNDGTQES